MGSRSYVPTLYPALVAGAALYLTKEDRLQLTVRNSVPGVTVRLTGRFLAAPDTEDDEPPHVQAIAQELTPASNRSSSTVLLPLGYGWLLNAEVIVTAGTPLVGQCYALLSLVRGDAGATLDLVTLAAGYITALERLATPGGSIVSALAGPGALRSIAGTTPGVGAEISESVPAGARWELLTFTAQFVTSATVATRNTLFAITDGVNALGRYPLNNNQAAGQTINFSVGPGIPLMSNEPQQGLAGTIPVGLTLPAGATFGTSTVSIQSGDQYSAIRYLVREWIEGA